MTRRRYVRPGLLAIALLAIWAFLLSWAAGMPWYSPLTPHHAVELHGADFKPVLGAGIEDGDALGVGSIAEDGNAWQAVTLDRLSADDHPILRYSFDALPRTLELSLIFRRADAQEETAISLPWPDGGTGSVDLSVLPDWHGEIVALGFAEYATAQSAPPSIAFQPFRLVDARLASRAWSNVPGLLRTAWFGYKPWALLSISALGPAIDSIRTASVQPALAFGALLSLVAAALILRWPRRRIASAGVAFAIVLWALLDLRWLDDLAAKHRLTDRVYAGEPWSVRETLQPDEETPRLAKIVHQYLDATPPPRVFVASESVLPMLRMIYFLLPLNAAPLEHGALQSVAALPRGSVVVTYGDSGWRYSAFDKALIKGDRSIIAEQLVTTPEMGLYRVTGAAR
ncbi:MAG TPA: hypothetical protein VF132_03675 [Rudaea sp.]